MQLQLASEVSNAVMEIRIIHLIGGYYLRLPYMSWPPFVELAFCVIKKAH